MAEPGLALEILQRRGSVLALNKPSGVSLLADRSGARCLWDELPRALGTKPYLVHRLDKGTSGVLLVAVDQHSQRQLTRAFQQRRVRKYYLAWVVGGLDTGGGSLAIDLPLRRGRKSRYRVAGAREHIRRGDRGWTLDNPGDGHPSLTRIRTLLVSGGRTLVLAAPATGRTHQLRVHLAWIGHPILGDRLYGRPDALAQQAPRLQLHCHRLVVPGVGAFSAPATRGWLDRT